MGEKKEKKMEEDWNDRSNWRKKIIERDSKRWTQFRKSIFQNQN